ncbi:MAG TPA: type II toxin-antitoxin system HigB family toxin [Thermodesulfobacteriota bacterium]|nr:type II toxin-antitoxin system HigB family toxin [Thermodesulfobacteriota bacterium]HNU71038.1 type II toxin-antitoxin system HigB family toxin [Thermodesulfobacteriota bacterium]HQQ68502.1 type II toxin-antitoxin system HigB family toxin [Candidatus Cloacimonadota bacterium]
MHVIKRRTLIDFYTQPTHRDAKGPQEAWYAEAKAAVWSSPADIKAHFHSASVLAANRVVFNIAGNKYRLIVKINYAAKVVFIRFIGTHKEYDRIDAEVI